LKVILLNFCLFFTCFFTFSQNEKRLNGKVICQEKPLVSINVVNLNTKKVASTNINGLFVIEAKENDELYIISKEYIDRKIVITDSIIKNGLRIELSQKPIELKEVAITQKPLNGYKVTNAEIDAIKFEKEITRPRNQSVYTGEIDKGMDFVRIAKGIGKLFKNKDREANPTRSTMVFKEYIAAHFQNEFFTNQLGLQHNQIYIFIEFCDADSRSNRLVQEENELQITEFLIEKSEQFKKLK
jgi:hypothetical protein